MSVTNVLEQLGNRCNAFYEANKAHIYTGLGIGGTIATGLLSARSGARSARKIDRRQSELGRRLSLGEKMQLCWTDALPPVIVAAGACYSTYKSDAISTKIIADRTAMYLASEKAYEKLSQKTKEVLGEKKAKQIQDEVTKEEVNEAVRTGQLTMDDFAKAPRVGSGELYRFVDKYTMLPFWSNKDYICLQVAKMREMMAELAPRDKDRDYYDKVVGIYYWEWLHRIGYTDPKIAKSPERKFLGFNKGYQADGSQDDPIDVVFTPMMWNDEFSVTAVDWTVDPSDMRLGRMKKTGQLD